ncbi:MAG: DUF4199 domain-containing protein [Prevotella sp.]|nr:DUF4199 domain-containing protein [Prevotella sp.]
MITSQSLAQLKAFARQDGLLLALYWAVAFGFVMLLPESLLGSLLTLATPFVAGWRVTKFRDDVLEGVISFRRGYAFSASMFVYAALAFALIQWAYFRFVDQGTFLGMLTQSVEALKPSYEQAGIDASELNEALKLMQAWPPIQWAFMFMMQNIVAGFVLSLPVAAFCTRRAISA